MLVLVGALAIVLPAGVAAESASQPTSPAASQLAVGRNHTCAVLAGGIVRCWGYGGDGELGYADKSSVGDDETPASVGPVDLAPGPTAKAISAGGYHTCAILDNGSVRCWGFGGNGRLGYGNTNTVGVAQKPGSLGPVDMGPGRTAVAISAGGAHTCAILDDRSVRCWGFGFDGQLGYGSPDSVGDGKTNLAGVADKTPASVGPVDLGSGHTAKAISAGNLHTCAILDDGSVRCWGYGGNGQLGYGDTNSVGDGKPNPLGVADKTPASAGAVDLGPGRTAVAISAGGAHTCAILDDRSVRCWGYGAEGQLGYGNTNGVGDAQTPASAGPVDLGPGRTARAISAGADHTCAILDDRSVRCWGYGGNGQLGYGNTSNVGDTPATTPGKRGPVDLGAGPTAIAIGAGGAHTCARLDNGSVRCWGYGGNGRLGYCNERNVGDTPATLPGKVGPVNLVPGDSGVGCGGPAGQSAALARQAMRARALRGCLARMARQPQARRAHGRRKCLRTYGRTPGRVSGLSAHAGSKGRVVLTFDAPGTDGKRPPAATTYLVKQSLRRDFARARALCRGSCRFRVIQLGVKITLTITHLRPHTTYYYAVAARDNVSGRLGARSRAVKVTTR